MGVAEITEKLGLHKLAGREWFIQGTCALNGEGLYDGLDWLSKTVNKKKWFYNWFIWQTIRKMWIFSHKIFLSLHLFLCFTRLPIQLQFLLCHPNLVFTTWCTVQPNLLRQSNRNVCCFTWPKHNRFFVVVLAYPFGNSCLGSLFVDETKFMSVICVKVERKVYFALE